MLSAWLKVRTCSLDLVLSELRTGHNRISWIESLLKKQLKKNNFISALIPYTRPCLKTCWVSACWLLNWLRFCLLISSTACQRSWRKARQKKERQTMTLKIWDHLCHLKIQLRLNSCGQWSLTSSSHTKTPFQEDMTTEEHLKATRQWRFLVVLESKWTFTICIQSMINSAQPASITIWLFRKQFKCTKVTVLEVSHQ